MYLSIGLILILSSTLVMHMVLYAEEYVLVNKHTKDTLFTSAVCEDKWPDMHICTIYFTTIWSNKSFVGG